MKYDKYWVILSSSPFGWGVNDVADNIRLRYEVRQTLESEFPMIHVDDGDTLNGPINVAGPHEVTASGIPRKLFIHQRAVELWRHYLLRLAADVEALGGVL